MIVALLFAAALATSSSGSGWLWGALLPLVHPLARSAWVTGVARPKAARAHRSRETSSGRGRDAAPRAACDRGHRWRPSADVTSTTALAILLAFGLLLLAAAPWTLLGANLALRPVQSAINRRYVQRARRSLHDWAPLVVGITGSYGKTTTKFCVGAVLEADRPTLVAPRAHNSFLGVIRTINEHLRASHRAFVVEMGMFRRGDIAELCELVHPTVGVITAIGPMHLERLGSIEQIAAAKGELLDALPPEGHLVTNANDPRCLELAARAGVPVTLFGIDDPYSPAVVAAASHAPRRRRQNAPSPIQKAASVSDPRAGHRACGWSHHVQPPPRRPRQPTDRRLGRLARAPQRRQPARRRRRGAGARDPLGAHRRGTLSRGGSRRTALHPIHNRRAGIVVIDDAYNSNPEGAAAALEVLREHPATRRLLVTPGMVELGDSEEQFNRRFGEQAGAVCDLAILVGPARTAPIREGLAAAGLWTPRASMWCATSPRPPPCSAASRARVTSSCSRTTSPTPTPHKLRLICHQAD